MKLFYFLGILQAMIFINSHSSTAESWNEFYQQIEGKCQISLNTYIPNISFSKIGRNETSDSKGALIVLFLFKNEKDIYASCFYNQNTETVEVNLLI